MLFFLSQQQLAGTLTAEGDSGEALDPWFALLRGMLRLANEDGKIQAVPKIRLLKEPLPRKGFLVREKFDQLLTALPDTLKPLVTFLYYCGVRLGEALQLQIQWPQVDLETGVIRLEEEQTKAGEARIVPLPEVLITMLRSIEPKEGAVFQSTNLRKAWQSACAAVGLGVLEEVEDSYDKKYNGLIIHDLRRSAIRNMIAAGVPEKVAMKISGHKTRSVFDRYHIVDAKDVLKAMRRVENLAPVSEKSVKNLLPAPKHERQVIDSKKTAVSSRG